ncbi:hypothetical protein RF11_10609 [Thelohanellus kitauei]|uniref:SAYSvFN domain-containing protein n=1 Tax=Thelohanellus kitauei TaxID=669202 RepID=A0A0C2JMU3_THEKT|nr:hypothetical protein RF11_10609 [Thelohanellus kitauei]
MSERKNIDLEKFEELKRIAALGPQHEHTDQPKVPDSPVPSGNGKYLKCLILIAITVMGYFSIRYGFVPPFLLFMAMIFLFWSLKYGSRNKKKASAYSVFNPGFKKLHGTFSGQHVDRMVRHKLS